MPLLHPDANADTHLWVGYFAPGVAGRSQTAVDQAAYVAAVFMSAVDFGVTPEYEVVLKVVSFLDSTPEAGVGVRVRVQQRQPGTAQRRWRWRWRWRRRRFVGWWGVVDAGG